MKLHDYQEKIGVPFLQNHPKAGLFLDMGLGKTAIVLSALTDDHLPALIVAPKRVAEETWPEERDIWRPDLSYHLAAGDAGWRKEALASDSDLIFLGRDNIKEVAEVRHKFKTLVVDESSGFKSHKSVRWKMANGLSNRTDSTWLLTGTPAPNTYQNLWAQIFLLDQGKRLEKSWTAFNERWYYPIRVNANHVVMEWGVKDGAEEEIRGLIEDICLYMESEGRISLPTLTYADRNFILPEDVMAFYRKLKRDMVADMEEIGLTVSADNAGILSNRLCQVAAGFVYEWDPEAKVRNTIEIHEDRIEVVKELIEAAQSPCLVAYKYKEEERRLMALPGAHSIHEPGVVSKWNKGDVPILVAHPQSAGHGLNLQHGGHHIIWSSPDWSLELWQQFNKRLHRQGQKHPVVIHKVIAKGTVDTIVYGRLEEKDTRQGTLLEHLKSPV